LKNYFNLKEITNKTNLLFEKFIKKVKILTEKKDFKLYKNTRKNTKNFFIIIYLTKKLLFIFKDCNKLIIEIAFNI